MTAAGPRPPAGQACPRCPHCLLMVYQCTPAHSFLDCLLIVHQALPPGGAASRFLQRRNQAETNAFAGAGLGEVLASAAPRARPHNLPAGAAADHVQDNADTEQ